MPSPKSTGIPELSEVVVPFPPEEAISWPRKPAESTATDLPAERGGPH